MAAAPPEKCDGHFNQFLQIYDFKVVCKVCSKPTSDITYSLISLQHDCDSSVLLAKKKDGEVKWRHIAPIPVYPKPEKYFQCRYYREGKGCAEHSNRCTYARSTEEAKVWNLLKQGGFTYTELITWLKLKQGLPPRQRNHGAQSTVKEKIHQKFPGQFMELCAVCLHSTPKSVSTKSSTSLHCSRHKHVWKAALVYRPLNGDKVVEIRPKPEKTVRSWFFCNHVKNGRQCQHGAQACWFVHSEVEMTVWTAESENDFNRSVLLTRPHKQQHRPAAYPSQTQQYACTACAQTFTSRGCFMNHCNTLQHSTRVNELNSKPVEWKFRDPPPTNQAYKLCERACSCTLGDACADAHSEAELQEWRRRDKVLRKNITAAEEQGLLSYQSNLLREYRDSTNANLIMAEVVAGVTVHCDKELMAFGQMEDMQTKWHFKIQSERQLVEVALLKQEPGASFSLGEISPMPCTYASGKQFRKADMTYDITVSFEALNPGLYEQWLVLDFDMRPVLLQKLKVRVGQPSSVDIAEPHVNPGTSSESCDRWHCGNRVIIPCTGINRTEDQEELLKEYKPPQISFLYKPANSNQTPLSHENYKERMHHFLYDEELAQDQIISRMNIRGPVTLSTILDDPRYGAKFALPGEMFCAIEVPYSLTPDTTEGQLLKRGVQSALIGPISSAQSQSSKVYEAIILRDTTSENKMHLKLPEACCSELKLQPGKPCNVEIQFRLDRLRFCEMHKAVDRLPDTYHVLPNIKNFHSFVSKKQYPASLNSKQQAAMAIIAANEGTQKNAPFLIYGPFGTGKTFMLATAAKELSLQPHNKVLICTHTNSSADLYVTRHFHDYVQSGHLEAKPLRIKAEEKKYTTTDPVTLKYCHLSNDGIFSLPDRGTIDRHRIVITTTSMAQHLHDLKLPSGYFTHILIDEASQMLECEALMPLGLAGPNTRVVLAGDHMQMGPKLFSVEDHQRSNHTLLNRLFHFYQSQASDAALKHRIIFNENYRSTKEIVDFVATHFYVGKIDVIKAVGNVPAHPNSHVLEFHHVRGECHLDTTSMSWCNGEEITKVAEIIQNVLSTWPCTWGKQDQSSICVLSDGCQVSLIRQELRKRNLRGVTVENIANVQGKQFRIIVMTAVQTRDRLLLSDSHYLEFFNDPCVLNTAMTRAQSQVVVVGDAAALCNFGKCSRIWKDYIEHCISKQSVHPATLTEDVLAQEAIEICKFLKDSRVDNSDSESSTSEIPDIDDPILRELLDEDKDVCVDVTSEGLLDIIQDEQRVHDLGQHKDLRLKQHNSTQHHLSNYKRCTLFMDRFDSGYCIPIDDTSLRIDIKGRANIGHAFPGDQVDVEITDADCCPQTGKVARVLHSELASKKFVCTIENYDFRVMTPINKCITKIYTPCWKDKPNHIAVRRSLTDYRPESFVKINEESKRNNLFVVQVLTWRERFKYPLGIVVQVLPKVTSLDAGLDVLDIEYQLHSVPPPEFLESDMCADLKNRKDYREITTFTIDPAHSNDLDDAISVRDLGSDYEIGVHIADVASLVPKDSQIDKYAQQNGTTFYPPGPVREPAYMFPDSLTSDFFSLLPEAERNAISLMVKIDKETNCIKEREFTLSVIRSDRKLSYDEAENILHISNTDNQRFDTLEDCVAIACRFSEIHRKARKRDDWCYKMADEDDVIGRRRAHMMVEDLMIMYNNAVAEWLLNIDNMGSCTPLRCQDKPDAKRLCRLKERFSALIPLSIHLTCWTEHIDSAAATQDKAEEEEDSQHHQGSSHQMAERDMAHHDQQVMSSEAFSVLTSVMRCLESAVTSHDIPRILDLVTTSDIYPQLQPLLIELRRSTRRASNLRSNSTQLSRVGHYDLQLDCYTWASSPIRRYIDVIVQRVMHSALRNTAVEYTEQDISHCCLSFSQKSDHQSKYDKTAQSLKLAAKLNDQSARKVAFVIDASPGGKNLSVSLPLNRKSIPDSIQICYRDMQLADQPQHDEHSNSVVLEWLKRVYSFTNEHIHIDLQQEGPSPLVTTVPVDMWQDMLSSVKQGNHTSMCQSLQDISFQVKQQGGSNRCQSKNRLQPSKTNPNPDHYFGLSLAVKPGDTLQVQLGTDTVRGMLVPVIQMLIVHDRFEICLDHSKNPTVCFSKYALHSSRPTYPTYMEYQKIWKPLCEMEAASSAVAENESIVIEDVELTWQNKDSHLMGSFQLPLEKKKQWAINCDLRHVFLCIRLRDLDYSVHLGFSSAQKEAENTNLLEVPYLTWVAHGITTKVTGEEEEEKDYVEIHFRINHMPMDFPNGKISRSSKFTVELIPKMLPDVRKENAIENLRKANQLVKNIALGKRIISGPIAKKQMPTRFEIKDHPSVSFPMLNNSQIKAIREALTNPFTVIQGPPGTGKTVVGVHLVYWFFQLNQSIPRLSIDNDTPMRTCILYCGPSNKSVDVVAVQLLKLREVLRPLRVYGDQMEMLEFPYPGSNLRLSRHYVREEKPKADLRSITLHHLIRGPENPHSSEILSFDARIKRQEDLSDEEIESYRKLLYDAKRHELQKHDIVLCTCTSASNPLIKLHFQQIIIDECAMATEPEAFIPLVAHQPEQIILLGDHKQLQPIVNCDLVSRLGMNKSLFERYMEKALMLDTQYRMHEGICKFPSMEFYNDQLKTDTTVQRTSVLLNKLKYPTPIIFGHVNGQEIGLVVSTQHGNENSKANVKEAEQTVHVASLLIKQGGVKAENIAILTPYNAQVARINEIMTREGVRGVTVTTIAKSQGSEWRYVIISTVRSCPKDDIDPYPTKALLIKRLGFVMDPNQMNVGITRAQHGLCIIGNRELLQCSSLWKRLLRHYREHNCVLDSAMDIQVRNMQRKACKPRKRHC